MTFSAQAPDSLNYKKEEFLVKGRKPDEQIVSIPVSMVYKLDFECKKIWSHIV